MITQLRNCKQNTFLHSTVRPCFKKSNSRPCSFHSTALYLAFLTQKLILCEQPLNFLKRHHTISLK